MQLLRALKLLFDRSKVALLGSLTLIRLLGMVYQRIAITLGFWRRPFVFNLDLHISVIQDIRQAIKQHGLKLVSWSISGSNRVFRKVFWLPDPVAVINAKTWTNFDKTQVQQFRRRYGTFLKKAGGFVSTYPPTFSQIYEVYGGPTLTVIATRYEWPHRLFSQEWQRLNHFIRESQDSRRGMWVANNVGDLDYLKFYTEVTPRYVPSLCDYTQTTWDGEFERFIINARSKDLSREVSNSTSGTWKDFSNVFDKGYKWSDLSTSSIFFVVPYNVSQMLLFELATMGAPVVVPSKSLLRELRTSYSGVLSELSFHEMLQGETETLSKHDPNNYLSDSYLEWWMDRADFYNADLMPNVMTIDSLEELGDLSGIKARYKVSKHMRTLAKRNEWLEKQRSDLISVFSKML
jgi:hypothetical protein